jgi:predicted RNase H-like nuclease (RuvC/YqgF family)
MNLDMTNRELEAAIDRLAEQILELRDRIDHHHREVHDDRRYSNDLEQQLKAAIRQLQATLKLPQLADQD